MLRRSGTCSSFNLHDLSDVAGLDLDDEGRYLNPILGPATDRLAYLIRVDGRLAGFILVDRLDGDDDGDGRSIAGFFVARRYRRQGVGGHAAAEVLRRHPGAGRSARRPAMSRPVGSGWA